jgi:hypothetical protein
VILTSAMMLCAVAALFYGFGEGLSAAAVAVSAILLLTATCCLLSFGLAIATSSGPTSRCEAARRPSHDHRPGHAFDAAAHHVA